eukprot:TRINITY_DN297_c2_g4_i1.p1 TRINITY_DN297_c2_g4~~TRINITY_DN297_c2_g4_i1.p1  ORF type:complete len:261 (+),score=80.42 TRINITY_DN297_c2_g4_i1:114-785(+)
MNIIPNAWKPHSFQNSVNSALFKKIESVEEILTVFSNITQKNCEVEKNLIENIKEAKKDLNDVKNEFNERFDLLEKENKELKERVELLIQEIEKIKQKYQINKNNNKKKIAGGELVNIFLETLTKKYAPQVFEKNKKSGWRKYNGVSNINTLVKVADKSKIDDTLNEFYFNEEFKDSLQYIRDNRNDTAHLEADIEELYNIVSEGNHPECFDRIYEYLCNLDE